MMESNMMIPGKKARNKRNEIAAALMGIAPLLTPSKKNFNMNHRESPCNPGGLIRLSHAMNALTAFRSRNLFQIRISIQDAN